LYRDAARLEPGDGASHFRLGVAYRHRHDSPDRRPGDFQKAIDHWSRALEIDPNDYIGRRRIQQYGPRQDKPYPFYDWVETAREEIRARGESPLPLALEPGGAETAPPAGALSPTAAPEGEPDPDGRIHRDRRPFIRVETTVVPETRPDGLAARIHVEFRPNEAISAHWNNEAEDLVLWVAPPPGWTVERRLLTVPNPPDPVSREVRRIEFEALGPPGRGPGTFPAYALYYVCEDVDGTCLYRRQDIPVKIEPGALGTP
ncbi:MAG: tetratricopeptide repeat protein, partial [Acidobacteria bacterium]|nr:tetratricopeptide repeat protein [Acidobacteriota bacterium]